MCATDHGTEYAHQPCSYHLVVLTANRRKEVLDAGVVIAELCTTHYC